tara:strand:+ start:7945 stop:8088 length:144 start_codon:yes stop_codon:yes gene_type:complete
MVFFAYLLGNMDVVMKTTPIKQPPTVSFGTVVKRFTTMWVIVRQDTF